MKITVPATLDLRSFDVLLPALNGVSASTEIHLDLSLLRFTKPAGLLPLAARLRSHIRAGGIVIIDDFPKLEIVCSYLSKMNFYDGLGNFCDHDHSGDHPDQERFVGISVIGSPGLSEATKHKLQDLITKNVNVGGPLGNSFLTAGGELVQNTKHAYNTVLDQQAGAWPPALIQCQYYRRDQTLHICVADSGVGIRRSIGAKDPELYKNEKAAINAALVLGMRGGGTPSGRGLGLSAIWRFMRHNGGTFSIRTGPCLAIITPRKRFYNVENWKGTVVALEIRARQNMDISGIIQRLEKALHNDLKS